MLELNENFRILRITVEDRLPAPAVVVVSSAKANDGAALVACGLARAFAEFRHTTVLVDASRHDRGPVEELERVAPPRLSVKSLFAEGAVDGVAETLDALRGEHDVVVVIAPPIGGSSLALSLAKAADGVLLAVRMGRRTSSADRDLLRRLDGRPVLGVVSTGAARPAVAPRTQPFPRLLVDALRRFVPALTR